MVTTPTAIQSMATDNVTALASQGNHLVPEVNNTSSSHLLDMQQMPEHNGNMLSSNCINQQQQQTCPNLNTLSHPKIVISSIENDDSAPVNCENSRTNIPTSQELNNSDNSLCSNGAQTQQVSYIF